ncbi:MAG: class I SAM-dependent methyltransferase [Chloroflexi bacterium]|nr:class I SAM-dependent methyltransferase [Chloroflexota bacterium]
MMPPEKVGMTSEQRYYEIPSHWEDRKFPESEIERFERTSRLIPGDVKTIADIGCGNGLFLKYLHEQSQRDFRLVGADRSLTALQHVAGDKVRASIDSLPFADNEFDLVTSLEVLEHLPIDVYNRSLRELSRISRKYLIISVPYSQDLSRSLVECPECHSQFNPNYHVRSFNEVQMANLLNDFSCDCIDVNTIGMSVSYLNYPIEIFGYRKPQKLQYLNTYCPVCGYYSETSVNPGVNLGMIDDQKNLIFKNILKKIWPKIKRSKWLIGIYRKVNK